jgi:hypothetical protein
MTALAVAILATLVGIGCGGGGSPTDPGGSPPITPSTSIGVVGCSQTTNAWRGWLGQGDARVWTLVIGYGGGAVTDWAAQIPDGLYWTRFDRNQGANPQATVIWWQLCDRNFPTANVMHAEAVLGEIRRRHPTATIYVTPLAEFERPETCGKQNIANSHMLTDYLVGTGEVERGPELPMVLDQWIQPPEGDGGCHVGDSGSAEFGRTLAGFDWRAR